MVKPDKRTASDLISEADMQRIETAVRQAESTTSAEIVPMIARRSSFVSHVPLVSGLMTAVLVLLPEVRALLEGAVSSVPLVWTIECALVGIGFALGFFAPMQRLLMNSRDAAAAVQARAELEFHRAGITGTAGKTGILLFLSLAERRAVVLADSAIAAKVPADTWNGVVALMVNGGKRGSVADGLIDAVRVCGELVKPLFPRSPDDQNEIRNHLRIV